MKTTALIIVCFCLSAGFALSAVPPAIEWINPPSMARVNPGANANFPPIEVRFTLTEVFGEVITGATGTAWIDDTYTPERSMRFCGVSESSRISPVVQVIEEGNGTYRVEIPALGGVNQNDPQIASIEVRMGKGNRTWARGLAVDFASPDLNGDRMVDLSDISLFIYFLNGPYNFRADLNFDGAVDLSDISFFSASIGSSCSGD